MEAATSLARLAHRGMMPVFSERVNVIGRVCAGFFAPVSFLASIAGRTRKCYAGGMESIADQLAIRDRFLRHSRQNQSPAERMADMMRLQEATWNLLRQSPEGYAHFIRRNFKARAITVSPPG